MIKFLTIARVLYDKGFNELIACASHFCNYRKDIEFQWLGDIDEGYSQFVSRSEVEKYHNDGIIKYLGFQPDVRKYINEADCIVLPSYHEGMSRVLMESLAMRKPIITSNIPGCKETVINGINGFLCDPQNAKSLIQAVERFLSLSEEKKILMGEKSREYAESRFDVKNVINVYDKILNEIKK